MRDPSHPDRTKVLILSVAVERLLLPWFMVLILPALLQFEFAGRLSAPHPKSAPKLFAHR